MREKWKMCCEEVPTIDPETGRCQNGCDPKPQHTPKDEPWIWLQETEDRGYPDSECGCHLDAWGPDGGGPAFFMCSKHDAGPELLEALKELKSVLAQNHEQYKNSAGFAYKMYRATEAITKAES